ncbi:hypothetical protein [Parasphingorhabdus marina]|nr:hypothetical protein [Parasphingorhabdus marina]
MVKHKHSDITIVEPKGPRARLLKLFGLVIMAGFGSTTALAGGALYPAQVITNVSFQEEGLLFFADNWPNPNNCDSTAGVMLLKTDPNCDKAYALILTAFTAGMTVQGYSDGCALHDGQSYNTIRGFKYLVVNK